MSVSNITKTNNLDIFCKDLTVDGNITTNKALISFSTTPFTISTQDFIFNSSTFIYKNDFDFGILNMDWDDTNGHITVNKTGIYNFQFIFTFNAPSFVSNFEIFVRLVNLTTGLIGLEQAPTIKDDNQYTILLSGIVQLVEGEVYFISSNVDNYANSGPLNVSGFTRLCITGIN